MTRKPIACWLCAYIAVMAFLCTATGSSAQQTTAFTYQGQLNDGGTNANGVYTMIFVLYDSASGGNKIGIPIITSPTLANGLFTVNLDFGAGEFNGSARWLDITVTNGPDSQELSPRVQVLPAPYALYANSAGSAVSLSSSTWSVGVTNFMGYTNVFVILANGSLEMGMTANGVLVSNDLDVGGNFSASEFSLGDNGDSISTNDQGDMQFNTGNLVIEGNGGETSSIQFPAQAGANIMVATNGDFTFDNNISISALGVLRFPGAASANISGNNFGLLINGATQLNDDLTVFGDVYCNDGAFHGTFDGTLNGNVNQSSDRNLKGEFAPVNGRDILERVATLPISRWSYKQDEATRHIGPMAQDFYAAFNIGPDDKHITTIDEGGVALAAIQGLDDKLKDKDAQIKALEKRLSDLEAVIKSFTQK